MNLAPGRSIDRPAGPWLAALALVCTSAAVFSTSAFAQATTAPAAVPTVRAGAPAVPATPTAEEGVRWQKLKPLQRDALKPLQQQWPSIDAPRKQKWLDLADRLPAMPADERARVQERMTEWARLTPIERGQARLRFQEAKQIPAPDRRTRWEAYQALPPEQKTELAARAAARAPVPASAAGTDASARRGALAGPGERTTAPDRPRESAQGKSNIVPNPAYAAPPRPIAPTLLQAAPGATTTLITRRPTPPAHQQAGLPKIAATPEFVNKSTLLPQRGAQGAAIRAVPAGDTGSAPRR
jgi:hypothetical protein